MVELAACPPERQFGRSQIPRQPVALERITADLLRYALDLLAQSRSSASVLPCAAASSGAGGSHSSATSIAIGAR